MALILDDDSLLDVADGFAGWRMPPGQRRTSPLWWRNGTSSTAIVSAGNGITKTCGAMYRWNIRPCRSRRSCLAD